VLTTREAFDKFRRRLELSETERKDAIKRHNEVRGHIREDFDVDRDFLTGSYGRHTKTKPLKDIDCFFVLGEDEKWRRDKPPVGTLDAFQATLSKHYPEDQLEPGRRCITAFFQKKSYSEESEEKVLSIDAVPAFPCGDHYEIPDRITGNWIKTNPERHAETATAKNNEISCQWVPLVKMLKAWNRHQGKPVKPSFLVEVMAVDLVDAPFVSFPRELQGFFASAGSTIGNPWPDPAGLGPAVSDQMTPELVANARSLLSAAQGQAALAIRAEAEGRQGDALAIWNALLGPLFAKT